MLIQTLASRQQLAGIFFNEAHELDPSLVSWRSFDPVCKMFGLLSFHKLAVPVIFMTATLRHPERILEFCGLRTIMDEQLFVSPMRENLDFELQCLKGEYSIESHNNIMTAAIAAINQNAPVNRAIIFVMYRFEIGPVARSLRESFPARSIIEYDQERRPDVTNTDPASIIVSTTALKTGTNLAETNLVLFYGCVYSLEDWLQGAGRVGRLPGTHVSALSIDT